MTIVSWDDAVAGRFLIPKNGTSCAVGGFDGLHRGHRALLDRVLNNALTTGQIPIVVTFKEPPRSLKKDGFYAGSVSTCAQRLKKFEELGFSAVLLIDFSTQFGKLSGENFISVLCESFGMKYLAAGEDFRCGYRGGTDVSDLHRIAERYGFVLDIVPPVLDNGVRISSSLIREKIASGDVRTAERLTGSAYSLEIPKILAQRYAFSASEIRQVLPPDGRYSGLFFDAIGKSVHGELVLLSGMVNIEMCPVMDDVSTFVFTGYFD